MLRERAVLPANEKERRGKRLFGLEVSVSRRRIVAGNVYAVRGGGFLGLYACIRWLNYCTLVNWRLLAPPRVK